MDFYSKRIKELGFDIRKNVYTNSDNINKHSSDWANKFLLVENETAQQKYNVIHTGTLSNYAYSYASHDTKLLIADLIGWLFIWDDTYPDGMYREDSSKLLTISAEYLSLFSEEIEILKPKELPLANSLLDLLRRLREIAPEKWIIQFTNSVKMYFEGCLQEVLFREHKKWPTLDQYFSYRHQSIGCYPVLDFIELASHQFMDERLFWSVEMQDLRRNATEMSALTNDFFSSQKESKEDRSFNALNCIVHDRHLNELEALNFFVDFHREKLIDSLNKMDKLVNASSDSRYLRDYCEKIKIWYQANFDWSCNVPRYSEH